ncbi:MAG: DUF2520 domain-containing protein [Oligoflexia bacterium]|nr:DUF2520 domain-containing protein [Oligoflexia bacterium]
MARHFLFYLKSLGLTVHSWSRRSATAPLPLPLKEALRDCSVILILVSDPAIEEIAQEFPDRLCFHFSGSLVTPFAHGAHPLMSFGPELYPLAEYEKIPFILEMDAERVFKQAFPALKNPTHLIRKEDKTRYHALCAMAGGLSSLLWAKLFSELESSFGIPPEAAVPFLERVSRNLATHPQTPERFFTGPIIRGDHAAVARHLEALSNDPYRAVYQSFESAYLANEREVQSP